MSGWKVGSVEDILDVSWGDTELRTKKSYSEEGFAGPPLSTQC